MRGRRRRRMSPWTAGLIGYLIPRRLARKLAADAGKAVLAVLLVVYAELFRLTGSLTGAAVLFALLAVLVVAVRRHGWSGLRALLPARPRIGWQRHTGPVWWVYRITEWRDEHDRLLTQAEGRGRGVQYWSEADASASHIRPYRRCMRRRKDPSLDMLRNAAGRLVSNTEHAGSFVTWVTPFWGLARPFSLQEQVWMSIEWADGQRDDEIEDYPPWAAFVNEVRVGSLEWTDSPHEGRYIVEWINGDEKRALLQRLHPAHQNREA